MPLTLGMLTGSKAPATVAYQTTVGQNNNAVTHTFTAVPIGAADPTRIVVVAVSSQYTAVTIGGIAATKLVENLPIGALQQIWSAVVPTGTTATIVVTAASTGTGCQITVWAVYNRTNTPTVFSTTVATLTANGPAGAVIIYYWLSSNNVAGTLLGGTLAMVTDVDGSTIYSARQTGASNVFTAAFSGTITRSNTGSYGAMAVVFGS